MMKKILITILPLIVLSSVTFAATTDTINPVCDPDKVASTNFNDSYPTSIYSTAGNGQSYFFNDDPLFRSTGVSWSEMMGCTTSVATSLAKIILPADRHTGDFIEMMQAQKCDTTPEATCAGITNQFTASNGRYDREAFASSKVSGSLLGYANYLNNTMKYEPVPVNMAYFFKDYASKLPIVGDQVFAANIATYGNGLMTQILSIWKIFRNVAYALMSLVMLWVGFTIITRRRIDQQTVVTVQYALPKIVIALVMIAFSYPIGALITSFAWTLFNSSDTIIKALGAAAGVSASFADVVKQVGIGGSLLLLFHQVTASGLTGLALLGIAGTICLILYVFALFKAFWIYMKMVFSTTIAPLQMVLYALPGNDTKLEDWLKQMAAWGVGLFGIKMVVDLTQVFFWTLLANGYTVPNENAADVSSFFSSAQGIQSGVLFSTYILPIVLIFGFVSALKVPSMVETMLVGDPAKKKR